MEMKQFDKTLKTIQATGAKMDTMLHECAMFALEQINKHGNNGPVNRLLGAINKSTRKEALYVWFNDFGKCKRNKDNTLDYKDKSLYLDGDKADIEAVMIAADETPFYSYTKEIAPASSYDVMKGIKTILKRAEKMKVDGKTIEHADLLETLKGLLPTEA